MITIELNNGFKCRYEGNIFILFGSSCGVDALSIEAHSSKPCSNFSGYDNEEELITWTRDVWDYIFLQDIKSITGY